MFHDGAHAKYRTRKSAKYWIATRKRGTWNIPFQHSGGWYF
jgi:hypothetical protein